jgi:hypothetical protein
MNLSCINNFKIHQNTTKVIFIKTKKLISHYVKIDKTTLTLFF